jgi:CheY-like chemotaxis protein
MLRLLRRLIGEQIELVWRPGAGLGSVRIDPSQVDQILVNLLVNARDAIAGTGTITLETAAVSVPVDAPLPGLAPGAYVCLVVSDTGAGMDATTQARLFEPYFTTKTVGQGTGLGLATVYGIVRQNGGQITVYSEVGRGTAIKLYLPRVAETPALAPTTIPAPAAPRGRGETVLVVEDERSIRTTCGLFLGELGYTILTAATPAEALALAAAHEGEIHLLLTDVVLPEMNGRELAGRLRASRPGMACLYMSGYTADVIGHQGILDEGVSFLQKPFSRHELAAKVRAVLGDG